MELLPAIHIRNGKVVGLTRGDPASSTIYHHDPAALAERFVWQGARWLHLIDLDRAFGDGDNGLVVDRIITRVGSYVQIQFGGGLRSRAQIARTLELDVARIVLGTVAITRPELVDEALELGGSHRVAVGLDCRGGFLALKGWTELSPNRADEVAGRVARQGVRTVVYTDISRDGTLRGPDVEGASALQRHGPGVIASGGVARLEDLDALDAAHLAGAVLGRALYEERFTLPEALARVPRV